MDCRDRSRAGGHHSGAASARHRRQSNSPTRRNRQREERGPARDFERRHDHGLAGHARREAASASRRYERLGLFPNSPIEFADASMQDPMCIEDGAWQKWADAWSAKTAPESTGFGIAYILKGDKGASEQPDGFARSGRRLTLGCQRAARDGAALRPEAARYVLDDPAAGGPFIMWKGTPYAHLMVPVTAKPKAGTMSRGATKPPPPAPKPWSWRLHCLFPKTRLFGACGPPSRRATDLVL